MISSDHGESLSKGYGGHGGPKLHEELILVPLLIKTPGQTEGQRITELSEHADLLPTILQLAGIPLAHRTEGISLAPAMRGQPLDRPVFSMNFQQSTRLGALETGTVAMIQDRWKYVCYLGKIGYPHMPRLRAELYDVLADPREIRNRIWDYPELAARMHAEIVVKLKQHGGRVE